MFNFLNNTNNTNKTTNSLLFEDEASDYKVFIENIKKNLKAIKVNEKTPIDDILSKYQTIENLSLDYINNYSKNRIKEKYYFNNYRKSEMEHIAYSLIKESFIELKLKSTVMIIDKIAEILNNLIKEIKTKDFFLKDSIVALTESIFYKISIEEDYTPELDNLSSDAKNQFFISVEFIINNLPHFLIFNELDMIQIEIINSIEINFNIASLKVAAFRSNNKFKIFNTYFNLVADEKLLPFDVSIFPTKKFLNIEEKVISFIFLANQDYFLENEFNLKLFYSKFKLNNDYEVKLTCKNIAEELLLMCKMNENFEELFRFFLFSMYVILMEKDEFFNYHIGTRERKMLYNALNVLSKISKQMKINEASYDFISKYIFYIERVFISEDDFHDSLKINKKTEKLALNLETIIKLIQSTELKDLYNEKIGKYIELIEAEPENNSKIKRLFSFGSDIIRAISLKDKEEAEEKIKIKLDSINFIKTIPFDNNPSITILISGFLSESDNQVETWEEILEIKQNLTDIYLFEWQASNYKKFGLNLINFTFNLIRSDSKIDKAYNYLKEQNDFVKTKASSKIMGKILAHFLSNQKAYNYKSINLVGFSLGCNIIKHCLKELYYISQKHPNLKTYNMINNVMTIAGATQLDLSKESDRNKISIIGGRYINVWSSNDQVLKYGFQASVKKPDLAIGIYELSYPKNIKNSKVIENINYSNEKIGHTDYRLMMKRVFLDAEFLNKE